MALGEIKQLSDNWIRPRMDERMQEFSRRVQQKLRDLATKGLTPTSPHIYQGLLDLAREELELRGRIVCEGYERVLRTLDCDMPRGLEVEIRAELETWMVNTAVQVRDVLRPIQESRKLTNGPELTDLRWPVVNKVAAELDILFAGLRARRRQQSSETSQGTPAPAPQTSTDGKRSKDLLRLLLLKVRDKAQPKQLVEYPDAQQIQHAAMLINDGLVSGRAVRGRHGKYESAIMTELTSKGHDFLDDFEKEEQAAILSPVPPEIAPSLKAFGADYPEPSKAAFVMMRFGDTKAHHAIVLRIREELRRHGIEALRADDRQYHDDLFSNILTYMHGCGFGIAVFERLEQEDFNPNVSLEVGYMLALRKPVLLLKDKTLKHLNTDLIGKLYRTFDPQDIATTVGAQVTAWLKDRRIVS